MEKRLKLKPSQRIKKRYLLISGKREDVEKAILDYIGILGWSEASPVFVKHTDGECVVSVERKAVLKVRAACAVYEKDLKVLRVSGTLKGLDKRKL